MYSFVVFSLMMHIFLLIPIINFFKAGLPFPHTSPPVGPVEDYVAYRRGF